MDYNDEYEKKRLMAFGPDVLKRGKKKQSPANKLTDDIIKYIKLNKGVARRVNSQGQWDAVKQMWRPSGMKRGFEDIDAIMKVPIKNTSIGIKVAIEIKIGKDKMSEYQEQRMNEVQSCGGLYIIAKTFDQFMADWNKYMNDYMHLFKQ